MISSNANPIKSAPRTSVCYDYSGNIKEGMNSNKLNNNSSALLPRNLYPQEIKTHRINKDTSLSWNESQEDEYEIELMKNEKKIDKLLKDLEKSKQKIMKRWIPLLNSSANGKKLNFNESCINDKFTTWYESSDFKLKQNNSLCNLRYLCWLNVNIEVVQRIQKA